MHKLVMVLIPLHVFGYMSTLNDFENPSSNRPFTHMFAQCKYSSEISYSFAANRYKELPDRSLFLNMPIVNANLSLIYFNRIQLLVGVDFFVGLGRNNISLQQYELRLDSRRVGSYFSPGLNIIVLKWSKLDLSIESSLKIGYADENMAGTTNRDNVKVALFNSDYSYWTWAIVPKICMAYNVNQRYAIGLSLAYQYSRFLKNDDINYYDGYFFNVPYYNTNYGKNDPLDLGCGYSVGIRFIYSQR
jgi:hypothetical protein